MVAKLHNFCQALKKRLPKIALAASFGSLLILGSAQIAFAATINPIQLWIPMGTSGGTYNVQAFVADGDGLCTSGIWYLSQTISPRPGVTDGWQAATTLDSGDVSDHPPSFTTVATTYGDGTYVEATNNTGTCFSVSSNDTGYVFFQVLNGQVLDFNPSNSTTSIIAVTPYDGDTIASSSAATIGAIVNVNSNVFASSSLYVEVQYLRNQDNQASVANPQLLTTTIDFPYLTSAGQTSVSTTTPLLDEGQYTMITSIKRQSFTDNLLNTFGLGSIASLFNPNTLVSTTTSFTVVAPTAYDNFIASSSAAINGFLASSTVSFASCASWTSFNLPDCLTLLFSWQGASMNQALTQLQGTLFAYAPWGYVTRAMTIIQSTGTTSIPAIDYTFPSVLPYPFGGLEITFNPWQYFTFYQNFQSNTSDPEDVWQIIGPFFTAFCWLWTAWLIFSDLLKIEKGRSDGGEGGGQRFKKHLE